MMEFVNNNIKNISIDQISFKLNGSYYLYIFFEDEINLWSKSRSINELAKELRDLLSIY